MPSFTKKYTLSTILAPNEPIIPVTIILGNHKHTLNLLIDTGFNGFIGLKPDVFSEMGLFAIINENIEKMVENIRGEIEDCYVVELFASIPKLTFSKKGEIITALNVVDNVLGLEFLANFVLELNGISEELVLTYPIND